MYQIIIYETKNGKSEIKEYITKLRDKHTKDSEIKFNKVMGYIRALREEGLSLGEPYIKKIEKKIWKLRPLRDRILFASLQNNKIILLNVFMKQTNKTPKKEIEKAKRLLKDYIERSK